MSKAKHKIEKQIQKKALRRIAGNNVRRNRGQNIVLIIAIVLVTILMTVIFGTGIGIYDNLQLANLRLAGTNANGGLYMATDEDVKQLRTIEEIDHVGRQTFIGEVTNAKNMPLQTVLAMTAYDDSEWEQFIEPTVSDIRGSYPKQENEIMVSLWSLDKLGIRDHRVGMTISLEFRLLSGAEVKQDFVLSGYYKDYIYEPGITPNSGNTIAANQYYANNLSGTRAAGNLIVSEAFAEKYGTEEGVTVTFHIDDSLSKDEALSLLNEKIGNDEVWISGFSNNSGGNLMFALIPVSAVLLVMISGYLLIYNIVNISVLQDLHIYGQLKTLGATGRNLKYMVRNQTNRLSVVGIPLGLLLGTGFAVFCVPKLLAGIMYDQGGRISYKASISPSIYLLTILFTYLTIVFSVRKGIRMAAKVSPVEALKYTETSENVRGHRSSSGGKLYRMAFRNVFRSRKKALVTLASLFFGFLIFLFVFSVTGKMDYTLKYQREMPYSFIVEDLSWRDVQSGRMENCLAEEQVNMIADLEGVESIETDYTLVTELENPLEILTPYFAEQENGEQYFKAVGLSADKLLEFSWDSTMSDEDIRKCLEDGTGIFLMENEMCDYRDVSGQEIQIKPADTGDASVTYTVLGVLTEPEGEAGLYYKHLYGYYGYLDSYEISPYYTSAAGMERLGTKPRIQTIRIDCAKEREEEVSAYLMELYGQMDSVAIASQLEVKNEMDRSTSVIQAAGFVISIFLIFMGVVNFCNVMFTGIYTRRKELATLESIGMTQRQLKSMLIMEGICYSGITFLLLMTVGMMLAYVFYQMVRTAFYFWSFYPPLLQSVILFAVMLVLCAVIPLLAYRFIARESIVERLRKGRD